MAISSTTALASVISRGGLGSLFFRPKASVRSATSGAGSLLGGATSGPAGAVYNSLGALLNTRRPTLTQSEAARSKSPQGQRDALLKSAAEKIDAGDTEGGRAIAERILAKNAGDITALRLVAHSYLSERNYVEAERHFARAVSLAPTSRRLQGDLANARSLQKSDKQVVADARRQLKRPEQRANGLRLLLRLTDRSPDNVDAYLALADGFDASGRPKEVIGALQEGVRLAGPDRIDEVISRARKLAADHPDIGLPRNILGRALQKAGRFGEAVTQLKAASDIAPNNDAYRQDLASGYIARALDTLRSGNVAGAQADLQKARALDPVNDGLTEASARIALDRADRYVSGGLHKKALGELSTAAANAPDDDSFKKQLAALYTRVGVYFRDQGGDSLALTSFAKAFELDPTSATVRRNVATLSHQEGLDALNAKNYDDAITLLDQARRANTLNSEYRSDLASAYDARGQLRLNLGQTADAIDDFKKGFALDPSNGSLDAHLSSALSQTGTS